MQIDQAVFTSARTERSAGYQLVAVSPGVRDADARELSIWGPSHDSLCDDDPAAESVNFHHLPSGAYCISKTVAAGSEYSERGGRKIYTQCLVVPAGILTRFGNSPFALLRAAEAQGSFEVHKNIPRTLPPIQLSGRAKAVDEGLLARLAEEWGADRLADLVKATLAHRQLGLAVGPRAQSLMMGLLNCFPAECRSRLSFSTGLKCSLRRPFRIVRLPADDPAAVRRYQAKHRTAVWTPDEKIAETTAPHEGWPGLIATLMRCGDVGVLADRLSQPRPGLAFSDLENLGNRLCEQIAAASHGSGGLTADEPLGEGCTTLAELISHLRRHPSSEAVWTRWVRIHEASIGRRDNEAATDMVFKACQIFGVHSKPGPRLIRRIEFLLHEQWIRDPLLFAHTLSRLRELKPVFGRDLWIQLARRIAGRDSGDGDAPKSTGESIEIDDNPSGFSFDAVTRENATSGAATDDVISAKEPSSGPRRERADQKALPPSITRAASSSASPTGSEPSRILASQCPKAVKMLEQLDDTVFSAIGGSPQATEELRILWPQVLAMLGEELVEESKQEYLRHALCVWNERSEKRENRESTKASNVVDVMSLLLKD